MKKYLLSIAFLLAFVVPAKAQAPWDLIYHAMPTSIGFDLPEEITQITGQLQTAKNQLQDMAQRLKGDISNVQSAVLTTFNKIKSGAILDIIGNPGQAQAGFCGKDVNKTKAKVIAKKVKEVLLIAQSEDFSYITEQKKQRERFFMDNIYAIHAASIILQQEVENDIKAQIDKAKTCADEKGAACGLPVSGNSESTGEGEEESSEEGGNNEIIFVYGKTLEALDSVVRLWESVSALKARLAAIKMINSITPALDAKAVNKKGRKVSVIHPEKVIKIHSSTPIAFAQLSVNSVAQNFKSNSIEKVEAAALVKKENEALQYVSNTIDFVSPDMDKEENALAGVQDQMEALGEMNEVETLVASAIDAHNFIKDLPQQKAIAEQYEKMKKAYKEAFDRLVTSEKCAVRYLSKYYGDGAHRVWSGNLGYEDANKHDNRKGISGWAFNAFELLKSGEATNAIEAFKSSSPDSKSENSASESDAYLTDESALQEKVDNTMSTSNTHPDEIAQETLTNNEVLEMKDDPCAYLDMGDDEECKAQANGKEYTKRFDRAKSDKPENEAISADKKKNAGSEIRKSSMLCWQTGAEASKLLGDPNYSDKWGATPTDVKLIWTDTKRFYKKYLNMKYDNIRRYMMSYSKADILELVANKMMGNVQKATASSYQTERKAGLLKLAEGLTTSIEQKKALKTANRGELDSKISKLEGEDEKNQCEAQCLTEGEIYRECEDRKHQCKKKVENGEKCEFAGQSCSEEFFKYTECKAKCVGSFDKDKCKGNFTGCSKYKVETLLNFLNLKLINIRDEINTVKTVADDKALDSVMKSMTAPVEFPAGNEVPSNEKIGKFDVKEIVTRVNTSSTQEVTNNKNIKEKENKIKEIQEEMAELTSARNLLDVAINTAKLVFQQAGVPVEELDDSANSLEEEISIALNGDGSPENKGLLATLQAKALTGAKETIKQILLDSNAENPIEGFDIDDAMEGIDQGAESFVKIAQTVAEAIIEKGKEALFALGDDLYSEASYSKVEIIHNEMIQQLKDVKLTFTVVGQAISPVLSIKNLMVFSEFLEDIDTTKEEVDFFVGATPKERDLKAPFMLRGYDLPPVREVFHFDAVDFTNVQPTQEGENGEDENGNDWFDKIIDSVESLDGKKKRAITKEDFLNYGGDIPPIWNKMLSDYPFVESRLPLREILDGEDGACEAVSFARGGVMPCLYGVVDNDGKEPKKYDYVLDVTKNGKYIYYKTDDAVEKKQLRPCASVTAEVNSANGGNLEPFHAFWKVFLNNGNRNNKVDLGCEYSELGMLLEADKHNNLFIRKNAFKNFNRINRREGGDINKWLPARKRNVAAAKHSELSRNQIGDFLKQAETEKKSKESLDEAEVEYEKSKEALYAMFKDFGFVPSKDFNLADEKHYKQAVKILKSIKKQRIQKAESALEKINTDNNAPAQEKSKNMKKLIKFMNTDYDSVLKISMTDADSNDFAIRLLKETVNIKIVDKFKKRKAEESEKFSDIEEAYCAIY